jgi:hypothetical protein
LHDQEYAGANQEDGPYHENADVTKSEFLQLKGNSQENEKAAPKPSLRTRTPRDPIHTEVDQDKRPKLEDVIGNNEPDLLEQQHDTHQENDYSEDEVPVRVP